ncbi:alkaline phosphatase 4-like isoform X2 [Tigriopus californicus]|uniref:alkaline phosphatase 4-like isoform X2 n=1 Tax=Tigriopus californicus TaxID=6832 RepID=UPI0027DA7690|nr:alkaline phosphatase 4-like isoform X2 [Tigriopus californicus]
MKGVSLVLSIVLVHQALAFQHHGRIRDEMVNMKFNKDLTEAEDKDYWDEMGIEEIDAAMKATVLNTQQAKNVIIFVGDGMSIPTLTAARIYKAQVGGNMESSEKEYLTFERFPHLGHSKTYDIDYQTPDSASTASAIFTGVKTKYYTMGYDSGIDHYDVTSMKRATKVDSILKWSQDAGKHTGLVTTARVTHATPAALYAHSFDRNWECDSKFEDPNLETAPDGLHDIAHQLVYDAPGNQMKVVMGGGYPSFYPKEARKSLEAEDMNRYDYDFDCFRSDNENLADKWLADHENSVLLRNLTSLSNLDVANTDYIMGLFAKTHVAFEDARTPEDPSLEDMTRAALKILQKNEGQGLFLMVEGGRIDHAHHNVWARRALSETAAMDKAVEAVLEVLKDELDETLIIVTADHGHTMSMSGYATRGQDIAGLNGEIYDDGQGYTTLSYANGIGYYYHNLLDDSNTNVTRREITQEDTMDMGFLYPSTAYKKSETHGGDDVAIFAQGPWSHLFHTTHEQSYIAHVMAFSSCVGRYSDYPHCSTTRN